MSGGDGERGRSPRRWGDNDHYFGPFTFARDKYSHGLALVLSSTDDEGYGCGLRLSLFKTTVILALPNWLLPPERHKVIPGWDHATIERLGRDWYWDITQRRYGLTLFDGHFSVLFGRHTNDSSTEQRWSCFLPWTQWRHVRRSLYVLDGRLYAHLPQHARWDSPERDAERVLEESCPTASFAFKDFDGESLTARTKIEEREWLFGEGWFKWLSWFRAPRVRRGLDIRFSGETGRRKGSWKGGTLGHSINMLPGELHASAFARYCTENEMTFTGLANAERPAGSATTPSADRCDSTTHDGAPRSEHLSAATPKTTTQAEGK